MASERSSARPSPEPEAGRRPGAGAPGARPHHARSFKLRFAAPREPGRSDVSLVKPLGLPATVAGKWYSAARADAAPDAAAEAAALRRVRDMFQRGPRDKYPRQMLSSHEYGWWVGAGAAGAAWLRHHIRDSPWMRERLRLLAAAR